MSNLIKYIPYLMIAVQAALTGKITFRLGSASVSLLDVSGAPVKFTLSAAVAAVNAVLAGKTGVVQSGDLQLQITLA